VRSLRDIGRYDGPIIVMTDQTVEKINAICEEAPGTIGLDTMFPNIEDAGTRRAFDRIERTLTYVGMHFGRTWSGWADQEAFNYIMVKMGDINSTALTRYARFSTLPGPLECRRVGFLHFWGHSSAEKVERMRAYLADLYREDGIGRALPERAP